ncbi:MAG: ABC transporter substrate-binding protein [Terracidiphilus sp.]
MKQLLAVLFLLAALPACSARTVTDQLGRSMQVPDHPHRIVCLMPSVVDDVYALGAGAEIVGVPDYTKYPAAARSKQRIGLPLTPSIETIVALHPDLVLGDANMNAPETRTQLVALGIPVFMVEPHQFEDIYSSLNSIGQALNREAAAQKEIARLRAREAAVRRRVSGKPTVSILMPVGFDPVITIGKHSFLTGLIAIAGGRSVTADLAPDWSEISLEAVMARQPEALLLVRDPRMSAMQILTRPGWSDLPAIRNKRIYYVDDRIELPCPVAFDALEELAKELHP